MQASRRALRVDMVHVLTDTCMALQDYSLSIAKKSVIVCTHIQDAKYMAKAIRMKGYPIQP
eukprot:3214196-Pyramimonas_sp.AAC.1